MDGSGEEKMHPKLEVTLLGVETVMLEMKMLHPGVS